MNKSPLLDTESVVVRSGEIVEAEVDSEVVALNVDKGNCYGLNKVGSRIWQLIAEPISVENICARLLDEYDVTKEVCESQVVDLLEDLRREDLIKIVELTSATP